jgi:deferrochelatase/peroxidase EfeB
MLRRGITFGSAYPEDPAAREKDGGDRGLLFLAYQTSIRDQFEFLTKNWMNDPAAPEGESGHDLLVGQESTASLTATLRAPDRPDVDLNLDGGWVVPTGGGYFFSPSISTLHALAKGEITATTPVPTPSPPFGLVSGSRHIVLTSCAVTHTAAASAATLPLPMPADGP